MTTTVFNMDTFREARLAICAAWAGYIADDLDVEVENRWPDDGLPFPHPYHDNDASATRDIVETFPHVLWGDVRRLSDAYLREERGSRRIPTHETVLDALPTNRWVTTTEATRLVAGPWAWEERTNVRNRLYDLQRWGLIRRYTDGSMRWQAIPGKRIEDGFHRAVAS